MSIKEKMLKKKQKMLEQMHRGKIITQQMHAERLRKKTERISNMKPGAHKAILEGLTTRIGPLEVMRREYERRKYEREKKP